MLNISYLEEMGNGHGPATLLSISSCTISYLEDMGMAPALLSISSCTISYLEDMGMAPATLLNRPLLSS